ncbi:MAG: glycosyltransferase [Opitutales bacterium]
MRVLHAIDSCDPCAGGVAEATVRLSEALCELGVSSEILSGNDPQANFLGDLPGKVHALGPSSRGSYGYTPAMLPWLRENAGLHDAFVVHGLWQYPGVIVRKALHGTSTPYYVYPHGMLDPWFKRTYPLKHLKKSLFWKIFQSRILRDARSVCFTSEEEQRLARKTFSPFHCRETVVGLGSVDPPDNSKKQIDAFHERFPQARGRRSLLFLARIHPKKGADILLQAFAQTSDSDDLLIMAGPCEDESHERVLKEMAATMGDRVLWTGMIEGDCKWGALRAADALILPSHQENFGIVVAEALSVGTPVLISDKVNLWREVQQEGAGLVAPDDVEGTCNLLSKAKETGLVEERSKARACFKKRFSIRQGASNLLELIKRDACS